MFVIRPIRLSDLDGLMDLLKDSGHGLTSLPKDRAIIKNKIQISERSIAHRGDRPNGESYLFVMEELFTGKIVGVNGIISKIGGFDPYFFYRLKEEENNYPPLKISNKVRSMHLYKTHSGPAEICSLFLAPDHRNSQNGRFLSLSRFLYMAENRQYFEDLVIAEMRGRVNSEGRSPFWDAVGSKYLKMKFTEADYLYTKDKKFIEELMPEYPILVDLLPPEAQEVVAEVHPHTEPAKHILIQEGFEFCGLVGIFEPGPVLEARLDNVRALKESSVVEIEEISNDDFESETFIISRTGSENFKCCLGKVKILDNGKAKINAVVATALKLRFGDSLRYVSFKP